MALWMSAIVYKEARYISGGFQKIMETKELNLPSILAETCVFDECLRILVDYRCLS